ncbi:MAG: TlpA disulfide reductase family protein [Bacteroidota bacterium]
MKKILFLTLISGLLLSCNENTNPKIDGYLVVGEAPGVYNGIRVYLKTVGPNGRPVALDTAIVMGEKFKFEGSYDGIEMVKMNVNSVKGIFPFILENQEIKIVVDKDNIMDSKITSGSANTAMLEYNKSLKEITDETNTLRNNFRELSPEERKALRDEVIAINKRRDNFPFEFLGKNQDNFYSLILTENLLKTRKNDLEIIAASFDGLSENLRSTEYGKNLQNKIKVMLNEKAALSATEIGKKAPDFNGPNPEGKTLALEDVMGKVTIVDFWAAWCGPCRRENPNVVKIYEKYHDKGLEIVGISLDGSRKQKDPKAAWTRAIKDDNLTWHHISNLNYFNDPIARAYNVRSIPATFVLDENGVIVGKNLRGKALDARVAQYID